ncbi:MAG: 30S ribosomal protein S6 [Spirochaeta sp. LUC14_002_19_P3]|nr:MAG: 30S ribosomal protein S6 [Spirochaeta sp. LUC14_002_19_P3]
MRLYELVCAFRVQEGRDAAGIEAVKQILSDAEAVITSEDDMGDREFAYEVKKETRGRYRLFTVQLNQEKLPGIEEALKLHSEVLRFLFVLKEK